MPEDVLDQTALGHDPASLRDDCGQLRLIGQRISSKVKAAGRYPPLVV
jgi:hypothetical protein